jgi:adenine phosphoribosyltransferase
VSDFRAEFLRRFRWIGGHADVLGLFADAELLAAAGRALAEPFAAVRFTKVASVEARGFVLGTAVALHAGAGFVPIRKAGSVHPGPKLTRRTEPDWRGNESDLVVQRAALTEDDCVLIVDDWAERGSQALAARSLVESAGASYAGLSLLVDQLPAAVRERLEPVAAVVTDAELPPDT